MMPYKHIFIRFILFLFIIQIIKIKTKMNGSKEEAST